MKILALETATDACSVAYTNGTNIIARHEIAPRQHTALVLPMVEAVLNEGGITLSAIDVIGLGVGPGSFTGVRVAAAITQGLALANDLPVAPLSTLAILAIGAAVQHGETTICPVQDARKDEVYWAMYEFDAASQTTRTIVKDTLSDAGAINLGVDISPLVVGSGVPIHRDTIAHVNPVSLNFQAEPTYPDARDALVLTREAYDKGTLTRAEHVEPIYLRRPI